MKIGRFYSQGVYVNPNKSSHQTTVIYIAAKNKTDLQTAEDL